MKRLYVCTTPFQVMTCIALNEDNSGESNLVINDKFKDSHRLAERVRDAKVFDEVSVFNDSEMWASKSGSTVKAYLSTIGTYIKCKTLVERFFPDLSSYTDIFFSSRQQVNRLLCMYAAQWLEGVQIHYFDDGLGTYSGSVTDVKGADHLLRRVFIGKKAANFTYKLHLYSPQMYREYRGTDEEAERIIISRDRKKIIGEVFQVAESITTPRILFDTIPSAEFAEEGIPLYEDLVKMIVERGDITIKPHPRSQERQYTVPYFENTAIPFEVLCSTSDFSHSTFFTSFSTAVFTPKMLFDQEPTIVLLYKLMNGYRKDKKQDCDKLTDCLKRTYRNAEKIIVPQNKKELQLFLTDQIKTSEGKNDF